MGRRRRRAWWAWIVPDPRGAKGFSFGRVLWIVARFWLLYAVVMFFLQERVIFPLTGRGSPERPASARVEVWELDGPDGPVPAWFVPPARSRSAPGEAGGGGGGGEENDRFPAFIVAHGNAETISAYEGLALRFAAAGFATLLVEFPGYGGSKGSPAGDRLPRLFELAWDRLAARPEVDGRRIVGLGRSIGTGPICALVRSRAPAALVLVSPFTSLSALAWRRALPGFFLGTEFDNTGALAHWPGPLLIFHGTSDGIVPYSSAEALARGRPRTRLVARAGEGHNDALFSAEEIVAWAREAAP